MRLTPDQFWTYWEWLFERGGLLGGFLLALILSILGFLVGFLIATIKYGPTEGFLQVAKILGEFFSVDLPRMSIRRIFAIAKLSFKEAIRNRILIVVAVFVVAIMFAGWFLDPKASNPAQLYIPTVLTFTNWLMLLMGLFLSTFSIPRDITNRVIYTIVTKPVRPTEIFLGRVLGFVAVATMNLAIFGVMSYFFIVRGLSHSHDLESLQNDGLAGETTNVRFHSHSFTLNEDGLGTTNMVKGHRHIVRKVGDKIVITEQVDDLTARNPVYGTLRFTGRDGEENTGYNVGYMSEYQKYIEGDTLSSAIWTFENVNPRLFPDVLNFDMTLSAFRTYKGDIETPVGGVVIFRSLNGEVESDRIPFRVKEFQIDQHSIPLKLKGFRKGEPADLDFFTDIAQDGSFEVVVRCRDRGQYLGMAAADLYLRASEGTFLWNFVKGYISIWLQMFIVVCFGVMFSTFLSGPVAVIATISVIVLGMFGWFIDNLTTGKIAGGGPVEALVRLPLQSGSETQLDLGNEMIEGAIKGVDRGLLFSVSTLKSALPNLYDLETSDFIAYGVNLFDGLLARHLTIAFGYFVMTSVIAYFFLKTREMAG
ncbi:ABC-2 family transporter protein [Pirellula sp. SH-Sr6A]|uniref:ABC transporter permease n=1 Tax=Pirellula sp. SH-Sr6A TaxID=1632865 RepID=UPI00078BBCB9|nr:ABC transporter permease [Pirellula sp. SH-Sr6A]AMV35498.1 ABC-2 family transporter protein [Pirellula sp. SH-Sr6A]